MFSHFYIIFKAAMEQTNFPVLDVFTPVSRISENFQNIQAPEMSVSVDDQNAILKGNHCYLLLQKILVLH